jgi:hypothetical protein
MSRKHLPAAVLVSIGCSVARSATPLAFSARTTQIPNAARQAVDPRDHQHITSVNELQQGLQLLPAVGAGPTLLLRPDLLAASSLERRDLDIEALIGGRNPGIAVNGHSQLLCLI